MGNTASKSDPLCFRLPAELWAEITTYFLSMRTLTIACRVCRRWRDIFTPILYENFVAAARVGNEASFPGSRPRSRRCVPATFLRRRIGGVKTKQGSRRFVLWGDTALLSTTQSLRLDCLQAPRRVATCVAIEWLVENVESMPLLRSLYLSDHGDCLHCDPKIELSLRRLRERGNLRMYSRTFNAYAQCYQPQIPPLENLFSLNLDSLKACDPSGAAVDIARIIVDSPGLRELGLSFAPGHREAFPRLVVSKVLERGRGSNSPPRLKKLRLGPGAFCLTQATESHADVSAIADLSSLELLDISASVGGPWEFFLAGRVPDVPSLEVFYPCRRLRRLIVRSGLSPSLVALVQHLHTVHGALSDIQLDQKEADGSFRPNTYRATLDLLEGLGRSWTYMDLSRCHLKNGEISRKLAREFTYPNLEFLFLPFADMDELDYWFSCYSRSFPNIRHLACNSPSSLVGGKFTEKLATMKSKFERHDEVMKALRGVSKLCRISVGLDTFAREPGSEGWVVSMKPWKECAWGGPLS